MKGPDNQYDYGMRMYDPRVGRFLSVDPLTAKYPFYSSYEFAGNSPIKFDDLDGAEIYDRTAKYWHSQPLIDISDAPGTKTNAAGFRRNANWFFKEQMKVAPEMYSKTNQAYINNNEAPVVDDVWIAHNPEHAEYEGEILIHHHAEGGELVAAIPERLHYDKFSELHPYIALGRFFRGQKIRGLASGTANLIGNLSWFSGLLTGDPDSWINAFGFGDPHVGDIKKDWFSSGLYLEILDVRDEYTPVLDNDSHPVIDQQTGKPKMRLATKTITVGVYSGYIWDDDKKKFEGVNKVGTQTEQRNYDEKGHVTGEKMMDSQPDYS